MKGFQYDESALLARGSRWECLLYNIFRQRPLPIDVDGFARVDCGKVSPLEPSGCSSSLKPVVLLTAFRDLAHHPVPNQSGQWAAGGGGMLGLAAGGNHRSPCFRRSTSRTFQALALVDSGVFN